MAAKLETLKSLRASVNFEIEEERKDFIGKLDELIRNWREQLPDLRDIFRDGEIERLLLDSIKYRGKVWNNNPGDQFIKFVARTGYKDQPELAEDGRPSSRRTTPVHLVVRYWLPYKARVVRRLFRIYNRFDVNYTEEESGLTHFHVACKYSLMDVVQKFLALGLDPNCPPPRQLNASLVDTPLQIALNNRNNEMVELLLKLGADPNFANEDGLTALHTVSRLYPNNGSMKMLFEICDGKNQPVLIDVKDKLGRTPLQLAVARLLPDAVDMLLDRGADLSGFVFPDDSYFFQRVPVQFSDCGDFGLRLAIGAAGIVASFERRGHELDRSSVLKIMKLFAQHELFQKPAGLDERWYDNEDFAKVAKEWTINAKLSLHDVMRLPPEQVTKLFKYSDYFDSVHYYRRKFFSLCKQHQDAAALHMCETISRKFFRSQALDSFYMLIGCRLPLECCEMILGHLMNEDLYHICLATADR